MQASLPLDSLYRSARAGDAGAEDLLCGQLRVRFLPLAKRRVRQEDVEDVIQDALVIIHRKLGERSGDEGILIWSLAVLRNVIGNYYQARRRESERREWPERFDEVAVEGGDESPAGARAAAARIDVLGAALADLARRAPRCGRIFEILLDGLKRGRAGESPRLTWEIVQREFPDLTRNAFHVSLHRCRERLREIMEAREKGAVV